MSANNEILITKTGTGYKAVDKSIESTEGSTIAISNDLESIIRIANKYMEEEIIEYGIRFEL